MDCMKKSDFSTAKTIAHDIIRHPVRLNVKISSILFRLLFQSGTTLSTILDLYKSLLKTGMVPTSVTFNTLISGCVKANAFDYADIFYSELKKSNVTIEIELATVLIKMHASQNRPDLAFEVFDLVHNKDEIIYTQMVGILCNVKRQDIADRVYAQLIQSNYLQNSIQLSTATIKMLCSYNRIDEAKKTFHDMKQRDATTFVVMISACIDAKRFKEAEEIYSLAEQSKIPTTVYLSTTILKLYCQSNRIEKAMDVFNNMKTRSSATYVVLMNGCLLNNRLDLAEDLYNRLLQEKIPLTAELRSTIITMLCKKNRVDTAMNLFYSMPYNTVVHTILLSKCIEDKLYSQADELILKTKEVDIELANTMLKYYFAKLNTDQVMTLFRDTKNRTIVTYIVMISGYTKAKLYQEAYEILASVPPDMKQNGELIATVLKLHIESNRYADAVELFQSIRSSDNLLTEHVFLTMISGCARYDDIKLVESILLEVPLTTEIAKLLMMFYFDRDMAQQAHSIFEKHLKVSSPDLDMLMLIINDANSQQYRYELEAKILDGTFVHPLNICILMLCLARKCKYQEARDMFDLAPVKDLNLWNTMLSVYKLGAQGDEAYNLIQLQNQSHVKPSKRSYVIALSACAHSGNIEAAERLIEELKQKNMLDNHHLGCMVDAYARKGLLDKAEKLALQCDNNTVWTSVLGGCKKFVDPERAARVTKRIQGSSRSAAHVLLANTYASADMMEERDQVRAWMAEKDIKKIPGRSNVKVGDKFYSFVAEDRDAPKEAMQTLDDLRIVFEDKYNYSPDFKSILKNLPNNDAKIHHLWRHSEKIALGVALHYSHESETIEITKNLRMCTDCHTATKLISLHTQRVIMINDAYRNHKFENGACECNDYY